MASNFCETIVINYKEIMYNYSSLLSLQDSTLNYNDKSQAFQLSNHNIIIMQTHVQILFHFVMKMSKFTHLVKQDV